MNPIEKITSDEKEIFAYIVERYGDPINPGADYFDMTNLPYILRFWNEEKKSLFKMFGEQLILEKEVVFPMNENELDERLYFMQRNNKFCQDFWNWFYHSLADETVTIRQFVRNLILKDLSNNVYSGETVSVKGLKLCKGMKAIKALWKLNDLYIHSSSFEEFRLEHSMILNQKEVKGTLCLSIHPLDYITMSDNSYEWDSCMSWINDVGSHRHGTIEMMNSSCVVVAYLKGAEAFCNWSDKKWRCLFIVHKDLISAIKAYPYDNKDIEICVLKWLRELAEKSNFSHYTKTAYSISSDKDIEIWRGNEPTVVNFSIICDNMYNDYYSKHLSYVSTTASGNIDINFSGGLNCMLCGDTYYPKDGIFVGCSDCYPYFWCEECEEWQPDSQISDSDYNLCYRCAQEET